MSDLSIRDYRPSDYGACRALWVELTQHHREIYSDMAIGGDDPGSPFDEYLANPDLRGPWVAVKSGVIVALTGLLLSGTSAEVEPMVVTRSARGLGIGRALVAHVKAQAEALGARYLEVRPVARNAGAFAFFVEAGFDIVGHVDLFQELAPTRPSRWESGIKLHGKELRY